MRHIRAIIFWPLALGAAFAYDLPRLAKVPVRFEQNGAQSFSGRGFGYRVSVTPAGHALTLPGEGGGRGVHVAIAGANPAATAHGESPMAMRTSYLHGKQQQNWRYNVESFARVRFDEVLPGVDVVYHGAATGQFEYDYVVRPGADARSITMRFDGQDSLTLDDDGALVVQVGSERIVEQVPVVYQRTAGGLRLIGGRYIVKSRNTVAFELGMYDRDLPLVIDPVVVYSGFVGGEGTDTAIAVKRSSDGYLYIAGNTRSIDLSTNSDSMQVSLAGDQDMFLMKVDPSLPYPDGILTLTYIGGTGYDEVRGMYLNAANILYLTGTTSSTDLPMAVGAYQSTITGSKDAFILKYVPELGTGAMLYSTYFGGTGDDWGNTITADASGNMYVAGHSSSLDLVMAGNPVEGASGGKWDGWLAIFDDSGSLNYSTYIGGSSDDIVESIALRGDGAVMLSGRTNSPNFPTAGPAWDTTFHGGSDGFVVGIVPYAGLDGLVYGTYLGGSGIDDITGMAFNAAGQLVVSGYTTSTDFPVVVGAYQAYNKNSSDLFVSVLDLTKSNGLLYSSYFGGKDVDVAYGMKMTQSGAILLTGYTYSTDFPVTASALQPKNGGIADAFVLRLDLSKTGSAVVQYSSYVGGAQIDNGYAIDEDPSGNYYVVGSTNSRQFPLGTDAGNPFGGDFNAFVLGVQPCSVALSQKGQDIGVAGGSGTFLVTAAADCPWTVRSSAPWIALDGNVTGVGNGSVSYTVAPNTSGIRQADLRIFDQKHTITQAEK